MTDPVLAMLLTDIVAHPEDDGPRLAYADRLEETGADDDRAEFIRVQCELEPLRSHGHGTGNPHGGDCPTCLRAARLGRRERRLLGTLREALTAELPSSLPDCHAWGLCLARHADDVDDAFCVGLARGFAAAATLPCTAWLRHGPALVRAAPLARVRLTDRTPRPVDGERRRHYWRYGDLPAAAYSLVACDDARPGRAPRRKRYPSRAAAESAASDALLAWARAAAP